MELNFSSKLLMKADQVFKAIDSLNQTLWILFSFI